MLWAAAGGMALFSVYRQSGRDEDGPLSARCLS